MEIKYLTVSSKNQITLNREVRNILSIEPGDKVYFENTSDGVLFKKLQSIQECPICKSGKVFVGDDSSRCLMCNGEGVIKDELNPEFIIGKLVATLLSNNVNIDIQNDEDFAYIINSKSLDKVISHYINECQKYIVKFALQDFVKSRMLISLELKGKCVKLFSEKIDKDNILAIVDNVQLDVIKNILREKSSITKEEYDTFVNAFDERYRDEISKFLLPFVTL